MPAGIDYHAVLRRGSATRSSPDALGGALADRWIARYAEATPWPPYIDAISLGELTYLFDSAPSTLGVEGDDRVVGVWGRTATPAEPRHRARQQGFLPFPERWSASGYDRGHFVAHSLGGGMDVNFFPQRADLNRGRSPAGRRWRAMERRAATADALLFVRPVYDSPTWVPAWIEFGVIAAGELEFELFDNRP